jgi:hypothetical protein
MKLIDSKLKITKDKMVLLIGGKTFLSIDRNMWKEFDDVDDIKEEQIFKAERLVAIYNTRLVEHYKRPAPRIEPNSKNFHHFVKALEIIERHEVSYKVFIDSQIEGLSFAKVFPKPNQLVSENSETRLLDYLKKVDVGGTDESRADLKKELKLLTKKIKEYDATMKEAKRLAKIEKILFNSITPNTKAYLMSFKNN